MGPKDEYHLLSGIQIFGKSREIHETFGNPDSPPPPPRFSGIPGLFLSGFPNPGVLSPCDSPPPFMTTGGIILA